MRKLDTLRAAIVAADPALAANPAQLAIWVEKGRLRSTQSPSRAMAFAMTVNLLVEETKTPIPVYGHALTEWARVNQPDLLAVNQDGITLDADILDNGAADVLFQFEIVQNVAATLADDGTWQLAWLDEPVPLFAEPWETQVDRFTVAETTEG